ncbi:hypothetical protein [Streptomyces sp. TBY4]|uniref:hypothetical protein n=1 Tax=Streptomyces sp. TBY4 TaxID=2962030 RepID=UPI0020B8F3A9|nr:hypothetical protein [Streptomyces sp. TBY4]MCP3754212.1 hypothetical protein [Streptomyces sp. TBY4]
MTDSVAGAFTAIYDPDAGRFLQVDPVPGGARNAYEYVGADPANAYGVAGLPASGIPVVVAGAIRWFATGLVRGRSSVVTLAKMGAGPDAPGCGAR